MFEVEKISKNIDTEVVSTKMHDFLNPSLQAQITQRTIII